MSKKTEKSEKPIIKNQQDAAKALEVLFATNYISRRRLYWENFVRGIFFSVGGIIGATLVLTVILWILSLFDAIPFIDNIRDTIQQGASVR